MEVPTPSHSKDLDVANSTFFYPDLTSFARLDEFGLEAIG